MLPGSPRGQPGKPARLLIFQRLTGFGFTFLLSPSSVTCFWKRAVHRDCAAGRSAVADHSILPVFRNNFEVNLKMSVALA